MNEKKYVIIMRVERETKMDDYSALVECKAMRARRNFPNCDRVGVTWEVALDLSKSFQGVEAGSQ